MGLSLTNTKARHLKQVIGHLIYMYNSDYTNRNTKNLGQMFP
jgi:hypothetical protein